MAEKRAKPERAKVAAQAPSANAVDSGEVLTAIAEGKNLKTGERVRRKALLVDDLINCVDYAASKLASAPPAEEISAALRMGVQFCLQKSYEFHVAPATSASLDAKKKPPVVIKVWSKMRGKI